MLTVVPGDKITVTASFSGYTRTLTHIVQGGGQQLDFSLVPTVLGFAGQTQGEAEPGKFNNLVDVATDAQGRVYATDLGNFRVQVFSPDGTWLASWGEGRGNLPTQFGSLYGIAVDKPNNIVYVVDSGNQRLLKYTTAGDLLEVWDRSRILTDKPITNARDVAVDQHSNVYILSDRGIYKLDSNGKLISHWQQYGDGSNVWPTSAWHFAVSGQGEAYLPDSGKSLIYKFDVNGDPLTFTTGISNPTGIAIDENNRIYVLELGRSRLSVFDSQGNLVDTLPKEPSNNVDQFTVVMHGVAIHGDNIYIASYGNHRILRLGRSTRDFLPGWGGLPINHGQIGEPNGIAIGPHNALYVADHATGRISKIVDDEIVKSWGPKELGAPEDWAPVEVAFDHQQRMYVVDAQYDSLHRFRLNGEEYIFDGQWDGRTTLGTPFCTPTALALDQHGVIFMTTPCDRGAAGQTLAMQAITDTLQLLATTSGIAATQPLSRPYGIAIDDTGPMTLLYVSDQASNKLVKFSYINGVFGFIQEWGGVNGQFNRPSGVLVDKEHSVYVAEYFAGIIQKFNPDGGWLANYGKSGTGAGNLGGPYDLAIDNRDNLYVSEISGGRIQRFAPITLTTPVATIVKLSATDLKSTDVLTAAGLGQDSDGTNIILQYEWSSNRQGVLGQESNLTVAASTLLSGTHVLSLRVQDDEKVWSIPVSVRIYVMPPPRPDSLCQGESWTMLLYLVGDFQDDGQLQDYFDGAIDKLKGVRHGCVTIAAQVDGSASIDPSGSDTWRWLFKPNQSYTKEAIDEQEMDAASTLANFLAWGQEQALAQHYYLAIANHGQGILGIGWDHTTDYRRNPPLVENNTYLTAPEIATALADPRVPPIDILHLDACSMALLDVAYELRNSAGYLIASQYLGWSIFAYDQYAMLISQTTATDPAGLARSIVHRYADLAEFYRLPHTLSVLDLAQIEAVKGAVDRLAVELKTWADMDLTSTRERTQQVLALRDASQKFNSNEDLINTSTDIYVDLLDFAQRLKEMPALVNTSVYTAATELVSLLQGRNGVPPLVLDQRAATHVLPGLAQPIDLSHAYGISIYFPLEKVALQTASTSATTEVQPLFSQVYADYITNNSFGLTWASRWDELLVELFGKPAAGEPLAPPPPPLQTQATPHRVYLPMIQR
jgi:DNA-binding beta-propeller fold protein YncE